MVDLRLPLYLLNQGAINHRLVFRRPEILRLFLKSTFNAIEQRDVARVGRALEA
jgi:hypothetical protein